MGWLVSTQWNVMTHTLTNGQQRVLCSREEEVRTAYKQIKGQINMKLVSFQLKNKKKVCTVVQRKWDIL